MYKLGGGRFRWVGGRCGPAIMKMKTHRFIL